MSKASEALDRRYEARDMLRRMLSAGDTITVVYAGQRSQGNQRYRVLIPLMPEGYAVDDHGDPYIRDITWLVANAIGSKLTNEASIMMGGWGYSKPFQIVYSLGRALYPDGVPCAGTTLCRSNDHVNGSRAYGTGVVHNDGGYAFALQEV